MESDQPAAKRARVLVRVRPAREREYQLDQAAEVTPDHASIRLYSSQQTYESKFDRAFDASTSQHTVYSDVAVYVDSTVQGFNNTIFAYGQTGTGKTYTMTGPPQLFASTAAAAAVPTEASLHGIVPRAAHDLFALLAAKRAQQPGLQARVECSYLEIYNERLYDLLQPYKKGYSRDPRNIAQRKAALEVKDDPARGMCVPELLYAPVDDWQAVMHLMATGNRNRAVRLTEQNQHSSRSHVLLQLWLEQELPGQEGSVIRSKLSLVDLAGSERWGARHTASGDSAMISEMNAINSSLSALGMVVCAVADGTRHVPYRSSKLTHLLRDAFGGNCNTAIIATLSPCSDAFDESLASLRFADRVANVSNKAVVNRASQSAAVALANRDREIARLRALLASLAPGPPGTPGPVTLSSTAFSEAFRASTADSLRGSTQNMGVVNEGAGGSGSAALAGIRTGSSTAATTSATAAAVRLAEELEDARRALEFERALRARLEEQLKQREAEQQQRLREQQLRQEQQEQQGQQGQQEQQEQLQDRQQQEGASSSSGGRSELASPDLGSRPGYDAQAAMHRAAAQELAAAKRRSTGTPEPVRSCSPELVQSPSPQRPSPPGSTQSHSSTERSSTRHTAAAAADAGACSSSESPWSSQPLLPQPVATWGRSSLQRPPAAAPPAAASPAAGTPAGAVLGGSAAAALGWGGSDPSSQAGRSSPPRQHHHQHHHQRKWQPNKPWEAPSSGPPPNARTSPARRRSGMFASLPATPPARTPPSPARASSQLRGSLALSPAPYMRRPASSGGNDGSSGRKGHGSSSGSSNRPRRGSSGSIAAGQHLANLTLLVPGSTGDRGGSSGSSGSSSNVALRHALSGVVLGQGAMAGMNGMRPGTLIFLMGGAGNSVEAKRLSQVLAKSQSGL